MILRKIGGVPPEVNMAKKTPSGPNDSVTRRRTKRKKSDVAAAGGRR